MRAHEAGALHGDFTGLRPSWLTVPVDVNELHGYLWPQNVSRDDRGELTVAGHSVSELARQYGTPAYFFDEGDFRTRCHRWAEAFDFADVYYAAKAFCSKAVLRIVAEYGFKVDVCTEGEMVVALTAGIEPSNIGLHGNNKSDSELTLALKHGIGRIVVDSFDEIHRLEQHAAALGVRPQLMVRVNVGVEAHTHEYIATAHEDQKFGFSLTDGDAYAAADRIIRSEHLQLVGLHTHIGSQIFDTSAFEVSAQRALRLHARLQREHGVNLPELDLGGGYGIALNSQDDPQPPEDIADGLRAIIAEESAAAGIDQPRISIEPGRSLIGPSMFTLYTVGTVKPVRLSGGTGRLYVSVDGGMSDNLRPALYDASYSATLASRADTSTASLARVVGKHCEAGDIVVKDEFLPSDIAVGDLLAVPGTGAYCRSMGSNYNHIPRPPVIAVTREGSRPIVARETIEDLLRLDVG